MTQEVLYRKWRPQRFGDVVGQEPVTTTLRHAVAAGTPAHAYLFSGPRGTGKTSTGRILAKAVNCLAPTPEGEPCNECTICEAFNTNRALDLIELDAASNRGIDEIRDLREGAGYSPNVARFKVYLIDEVHMLTDAAFNALLKTLEEPPPHVIFVLATTEPHRIPATIVSRCQRFDFRRIPLDGSVGRLRQIVAGEGITIAEGGLELIARQATGSLRDAENLLDQAVAYHGHELTIEDVRAGLGLIVDRRTGELARAAITRDLAAGLATLEAVRNDGFEMRAFIREVVATLRSVLLALSGGVDQLGLSDAEVATLREVARGAQVPEVVAALRALGSIDFKGDAYDSLPAEIAFASLAVGLEDAPPQAAGLAGSSSAGQPSSAPPPSATDYGPQGAAPRPRAAQPARPPAQRASSGGAGAPGGGSAPRAQPSREPRAPERAPDRAPPPRAERVEREAPPPVEERPFVAPDAEPASAELVALRERWGEVRDAVNEHDRKAAALLNRVSYPRTLTDDRVEIGFISRPLMEMAQNPAVLKVIANAIAGVVGRTVEAVPVLWEELRQSGGGPVARTAGGHLVDEALKQGAELVTD